MATSIESISLVIAQLNGIREHLEELEKMAMAGQFREKLPSDMFYHLPAALYIVEEGVFKLVSPRLTEITGYSEGELIGRSPLNIVAPEDSDRVNQGLLAVLNQQRPLVHQYRIATKDARIKWVLESATPMFDTDKKALIANLIDITELKQTEESGRVEDEKYRDLCENTSDMVQCTTPDGLITYTNPAWRHILGYSEAEIRNLSLLDITPPEYRDYWLHILHQAIARERTYDIDSVLIAHSGSRINVQGTMNCRFAGGKPVYTRGILRDVTRLKQELADRETAVQRIGEIQSKLEQSQREFEEFVHIASHDLREPLRKISSFGTLLKESLEDKLDDDQRENLSFMTDGAERMQSMIDDLLAYSRITTKAKPFQPVDLNEVVDNLRNLELAAALEETNGKIVVPNPLLTVYGDPGQLHGLLQNLIANGLKFHRDNVAPVVSISSYPTSDNMIRINVQDNGIGIDAGYHEQIFVMFKRLHPATRYPGTGIGLAVCRKIVSRHGGEIGVESLPEDGTIIWFTLPRFSHV